MMQVDALLKEALQLPARDRAYLADALEESLADEDFISQEAMGAWSAEVDRRLAAYANGGTAIDAIDSLANARRVLESYRSAALPKLP